MDLVRWEPLREMEDLFNRYGRLLGRNLTQQDGGDLERMSVADWRPNADISETRKEYLIKADLPGVKREDANVSINEGVITIEGERKSEEEEKDEKRHRVESFYGKFSRSFSLPDDVTEDRIAAEYKDGVLKVHLPKGKEVKPKEMKIPVK